MTSVAKLVTSRNMKTVKRLDKWGGSNYINVPEVRAYVNEWAVKVDAKRRDWFTKAGASCLLSNLGLTYHLKVPLPELPTRPPHDLPDGPDRLHAMLKWEQEVDEIKRIRKNPTDVALATKGRPVDIRWGHVIGGRYAAALLERLPEKSRGWAATAGTVHAFMPDGDLAEALDGVVTFLNSPLPEMERLTFRQFDQLLELSRNTDLSERLGQISRAEAARRFHEVPISMVALGLRRLIDFPDGHFWAQLVPTPDEVAGRLSKRNVPDGERTVYSAVWEECNSMSNGQGVAHFCIANGNYDSYLEGEGMIVSLRDPLNRPHVTVAIRQDGSVDQLQGRCNSVPRTAYFPHIWKLAEQYPLKALESSSSNAKHTGLVNHDGRFVPITMLRPGDTVEGNVSLKGLPEGVALPDRLTIHGSLDVTDYNLSALPNKLTVQDDLRVGGSRLKSLPGSLWVGRRLDIRGTAIQHLPDDCHIEDFRCGPAIPELEVRALLARVKVDSLMFPKFKRFFTGLGDSASEAEVEKAWTARLEAGMADWEVKRAQIIQGFMTKTDGNIALLVARCYSGK